MTTNESTEAHTPTESDESRQSFVERHLLSSRSADVALAFISFIESVIAPIIIDPFLIAYIMARRSRWLRYVFVSVIFSVLGGIAGYLLGALFFESVGEPILSVYSLEDDFYAFADRMGETGFVFVLLGALTPIPYKLVAIASGFFEINFLTFVIASLVGRLLRLGLVGLSAYAVGPTVLPVIRTRLKLFATVVGVILLFYIIFQFV